MRKTNKEKKDMFFCLLDLLKAYMADSAQNVKNSAAQHSVPIIPLVQYVMAPVGVSLKGKL